MQTKTVVCLPQGLFLFLIGKKLKRVTDLLGITNMKKKTNYFVFEPNESKSAAQYISIAIRAEVPRLPLMQP